MLTVVWLLCPTTENQQSTGIGTFTEYRTILWIRFHCIMHKATGHEFERTAPVCYFVLSSDLRTLLGWLQSNTLRSLYFEDSYNTETFTMTILWVLFVLFCFFCVYKGDMILLNNILLLTCYEQNTETCIVVETFLFFICYLISETVHKPLMMMSQNILSLCHAWTNNAVNYLY